MQAIVTSGEQLLELVYEESRKLAAVKIAQEKPGQTIQPTALFHEAWLRLSGAETSSFQNLTHFFGAVAKAIRRILIEGARRRLAAKQVGRRFRWRG